MDGFAYGLHGAVITLRMLNPHEISREIRDALRQVQDAYSEELDIASSKTSSRGGIEPDNPEDTDFEEGRMEKYDDQRRAKSQQAGAEQKTARGNEEQIDQEHQVNTEEGHIRNSEDKDHLEAKLEEVLTPKVTPSQH